MNREGESGWKPGCGCIALALTLPILVVIVLIWLAPRLGLESNEVAYISAAVVITLVTFPPLIVLIGLVIGWIWAPFAALVCGHVARARGLEARKFAAVGALYSTLFFWPWVYLVLRMHGRTVPTPMIRGAYIVLYAVIWPATVLAFFPAAWVLPHPFWVVSPLLMLVNAVTWFISRRKLSSWHQRRIRMQGDPAGDVLPNRAYIMPFVHAFAWVLVAIVLWWLANFSPLA